MHTSLLRTVLAVALVGLACDDTTAPATSFQATLSGGDEVPAVNSTGTATATFTISGTSISYTLTIREFAGGK